MPRLRLITLSIICLLLTATLISGLWKLYKSSSVMVNPDSPAGQPKVASLPSVAPQPPAPKIMTGQAMVKLSAQEAIAIRESLKRENILPKTQQELSDIDQSATNPALARVISTSAILSVVEKNIIHIEPVSPGSSNTPSSSSQWFTVTFDSPETSEITDTNLLKPRPNTALTPEQTTPENTDGQYTYSQSTESLTPEKLEELEKLEETSQVIADLKEAGIETKPVQLAYALQDYAPNDPLFNTGEYLWGTKAINAPQAWQTSRGTDVVVAVIDSGVDYTHEDIAQNIWTNPGETGTDSQGQDKRTNGIDDDNNSYIDDWRGWDFVNNDNDPMDDHGHGTHVAGSIAAVGNNSLGIIGIAPEAKILAVKAIDTYGDGTDPDLTEAIEYATAMGANIINNSWGGYPDYSFEPPNWETALETAASADILNIAAAGNDDENTVFLSPANQPSSIAVGFTDQNNNRNSYSNWGHTIDIAAPGINIVSLRASGTDMYTSAPDYTPGDNFIPPNDPSAKYYLSHGSSMAAPHIAGMAALVKSAHPAYSSEEIWATMRSATTPLTPDKYIGTGLANATTSVNVTSPPPLAWLQDFPSNLTDYASFFGTAWSRDLDNFELLMGEGENPTEWSTISSGQPSALRTFIEENLPINSFPETSTVKLVATDTSGDSQEDVVILTKNLVDFITPIDSDIFSNNSPARFTARTTRTAIQVSAQIGEGVEPSVWSDVPVQFTNNDDLISGSWDPSGLAPGVYSLRFDVGFDDASTAQRTVRGLVLDENLVAGWPVDRLTPNPENAAQRPSQIAYAADLDNDTLQEVISLSSEKEISENLLTRYNNTLTVYGSDGTKLWEQQSQRSLPRLDDYTSPIAIGDADNDGTQEIFYLEDPYHEENSSRYLKLLRLKPDGSSEADWPVLIPRDNMYGFVNHIAMANVTGDSQQEILIYTLDKQTASAPIRILYIVSAQGDVLSTIALDSLLANEPAYLSLAVANITGDEKLEIVTGSQDNISIHTGDGQLFSQWDTALAGYNIGWLVSADYDSDGYSEIATSLINTQGGSDLYQLLVMGSDGTALPGWPKTIPGNPYTLSANLPLSIAYLDGNSPPSLIHSLITQDGPSDSPLELHTMAWNADASMRAGWPKTSTLNYSDSPWNDTLLGSSIADMNGDGFADIIQKKGGLARETYTNGTTSTSAGISAWQNNGTEIDINTPSDGTSLYTLKNNDNAGRMSFFGVSRSLTTRSRPPIITDLDNNGLTDILFSQSFESGWTQDASNNIVPAYASRTRIYRWELPLEYITQTAHWPQLFHDNANTNRAIAPPQPSATPTASPDPSDSPAPSASPSPGSSPSTEPSPSASPTPGASPTISPSPSASPSPDASASPSATISPPPQSTGVIGTHIFYGNSIYSETPAPDKKPLLPEDIAPTIENISSHTLGINGLIIDIASAPNPAGINNESFEFTTIDGPINAQSIRTDIGAGENGSDRVIITFPDHTIQDTWLDVIVNADSNTGLDSIHFFTFGHLTGATVITSDEDSFDFTDLTDIQAIYDRRNSSTSINSLYDINRDGKIDFSDSYEAWMAYGSSLFPL